MQPATGATASGRAALDPSLPAAHGAGLPTCTATIDFPVVDYTAAMGWVQLVRSTDSARPDVFELDPLALHSDLNTPYAFFGIAPTLFDAPYRDSDHPLVWQARSYLAVSSDAVLAKEARPVVAFSWGFRIEAGSVTLQAPTPLDVAHWTDHLDVLEDAHPGWSFRS